MPTRPASRAPAVYTLRVELCHIQPLIWRRLLVKGNTTLPSLHITLRVVMGWTNFHLHSFSFGERRYGIPDDLEGPKMLDERGHTLVGVLGEAQREFIYVYDFGDYWEHRVVVETVDKARRELQYPICVAGERACPPEDVGGPPGYQEFLDAVRDSSHEQHGEYLRWIGGVFDPEGFDLNSVNRALRSARH